MSAEDRAANERGALSAGQRRRVATHCRRWAGIMALAALLAAGGAAILGLAGSREALGPGWAAAGGGGVAAGLLALGAGWRQRALLLAALERGAVAAVEGAVSYRISQSFGLIRVNAYAIRAAGRRFAVSQEVMFAFASQGRYRIYFAPGTSLFFGAVPLAAAPGAEAASAPFAAPEAGLAAAPAAVGPISPAAAAPAPAPPPAEQLTPRELRVLGLICEGLSNQEIAERLHLAVPTVKMHASQIYAKLGVRRRAEAAAAARRWNLLAGGDSIQQ